MITIKAPKMGKAKKLLSIAPKEVKKAQMVSIRRATTRLKKIASVKSREEYQIKAGTIKGTMKSKVLTSGSKIMGMLDVRGSTLPLTDFRVTIYKDRRKTLKAKVLKRGALKPVPGMFLFGDPKNKFLYMRTTAKRTPLKIPRGPSVPQMVGNDKVLKGMTEDARRVLIERFNHEVEYRLGRLIGR